MSAFPKRFDGRKVGTVLGDNQKIKAAEAPKTSDADAPKTS